MAFISSGNRLDASVRAAPGPLASSVGHAIDPAEPITAQLSHGPLCDAGFRIRNECSERNYRRSSIIASLKLPGKTLWFHPALEKGNQVSLVTLEVVHH